MKLTLEVEIPEEEIRKMILGIPKSWFENPGEHPLHVLALALVRAYRKVKGEN